MSAARPTQKATLFTFENTLHEFVARHRQSGKSVGLVPTMGALHEGHLSLVSQCNAQCDISIVSIYVNPTQFGPDEDLVNYPRTLDDDLALLSEHVDAVFAPSDETMYPKGFSTLVQPPAVSKALEGEFRADHFQGVTTIVLKLLNLVSPHKAFFGQKDFQQVQVLKAMVTDLNVPVEIVTCPIKRDEDGLALSSRNRYLDDGQRQQALALSKCWKAARESILQGETDGHALMAEMKQELIDGGVTDIDYAVVAHPNSLKTMETISLPAVLLIAAYVDQVRLIDNCLVHE